MTRLKVGLFLATQWPAGHDLDREIARLEEQVRAARDNGFSSIWVGQHFLTGPLQMLQMTPLLARLSAAAPGLTFGSAVVLLPMLNPVDVAEESASLDWMTGGRYVLGVGIGYRPEEFRAHGVPFAERARRFTEGIEVVRKLCRDDIVRHQGTFYDVDGLSAGIRPRNPAMPIWIGGQVDAAVKRAARLGDAWFPAPTQTFPSLVRSMALYRESRLAHGLSIPAEQPLIRECFLGESRSAAFATASGPLSAKYASYAAWGETGTAPDAGSTGGFEATAKDQFIIGDRHAIADEFARHRDALGVNHMIVRMQWPGLPHADTMAAIARMGALTGGL